MVKFDTVIEQFKEQGEKTGWTYILIPAEIAEKLQPGSRKGFRVKGKLDSYTINKIALLPMGEGDFIMPLNATMRKNIHKHKGDKLRVQLEVDKEPMQVCPELMECLNDEPKALEVFNSLANSHRLYFSKWIESAKTEATKTKRISHTVDALSRNQDFGTMLRSLKKT